MKNYCRFAQYYLLLMIVLESNTDSVLLVKILTLLVVS
jgi:hypothetical protein